MSGGWGSRCYARLQRFYMERFELSGFWACDRQRPHAGNRRSGAGRGAGLPEPAVHDIGIVVRFCLSLS